MVYFPRSGRRNSSQKTKASASVTRGSEPIEKNISVIDDYGNEYEATYPKRAKGLVKKGRARFVDDSTICLACPPDIMEDTIMSDNNIKTNIAETVDKIEEIGEMSGSENSAGEQIESAAVEKSRTSGPELSVGYILSQIEKIQQDNEHIYKALESLSGIVTGQGPADVAGEGKANGIADTVKCRETTNQRLIEFYEKLYDDIKQDSADCFNRPSMIDIITAIERCDAGMMNAETSKELKAALLERLRLNSAPKSTKEMALEIISKAVNRNYGDSDPEQLTSLAEAISSMLDGIRHIDH